MTTVINKCDKVVATKINKMTNVNRTKKVRNFIEKMGRSAKIVSWEDIPNNLQRRLTTAWCELGFTDELTNKIFAVEKHTPSSYEEKSGFNIHNNTQGHSGAVMTMLYYFNIKGIASNLRFYEQTKRKGFFSKALNYPFPVYNEIGKINIEEKNVIAFKSNTKHQPHSTRLKGNSQFQRDVLAIFVKKQL